MNIEKIVEEAFELYMPQDKDEITQLAQFMSQQVQQGVDICMGRDIEVPKPYNVLEIGTKFGGTFYIWNKIIEDHGAGMCISIDMSDGGIHGGIEDEMMDARDLVFKRTFNDCHFIRGDSHHYSTYSKVQMVLRPNASGYVYGMPYADVDFFFIDGDHTYEGVKQDFEMYSPFVKKGGCIAFHDINDTQRHRDRNVYVGKFWNEIKNDKRFETVEFNSNLDWAGIGVLIVK